MRLKRILKTFAILPRSVALFTARCVGGFALLCLKHAWFRANTHAKVYSSHVGFEAKLGQSVCIGTDAIVTSEVTIGDYTYIGADSHIGSGSIGKFCSIAPRVCVGPTEHPSSHVSSHPATYSEPGWGIISEKVWDSPKPAPVIGNDVWIGCNAVVLRGVTIGDGAIVGASAVVTRDIPPFAIAVGIPARVIGYRFDQPTVEKLAGSRWWDDLNVLKDLLADPAAVSRAVSDRTDTVSIKPDRSIKYRPL